MKVKVEPEAEDDAGRRNEDAGDDVFEIRGSKTLADLRVVVEKYIVRPWEENKDEHEDVSLWDSQREAPRVSQNQEMLKTLIGFGEKKAIHGGPKQAKIGT